MKANHGGHQQQQSGDKKHLVVGGRRELKKKEEKKGSGVEGTDECMLTYFRFGNLRHSRLFVLYFALRPGTQNMGSPGAISRL